VIEDDLKPHLGMQKQTCQNLKFRKRTIKSFRSDMLIIHPVEIGTKNKVE
jgi:hypothetical protein